MNAPLAKRPRHSDDFDTAPAAQTTSRSSFYDNVPRTSMNRVPSGSSSAMPAPGLPSHLTTSANGVNGSSSKTSPHLSAARRPNLAAASGANHYLSSGAEDNEEMAPPRSSSTAQGRAARGGRGRAPARGRGRGRGAVTASSRTQPDGYANGHPADDAESDTPPNPLTFQCRICFRLLGDSFAFVATDTELGYVILSDVSEIVTQDTSYETSTEPGKDIGSTFARLRCTGCNTTIGRNYRTTPRDLDDLRDCYSLEVDAIYTYQLGSNYTRQTEKDEEEGEKIEKASRQITEGSGEDTQLREKMEKTRALTIELSDRLIKAEEDIQRYSALVDELISKKSVDVQDTPAQPPQPEAEVERDNSAAIAMSDAPGTPPLDSKEQEVKEPEPAIAEEQQVTVELEAVPPTPARETRASRSAKPANSAVTSGSSLTTTTTSTRSSRRSGLSPARFL